MSPNASPPAQLLAVPEVRARAVQLVRRFENVRLGKLSPSNYMKSSLCDLPNEVLTDIIERAGTFDYPSHIERDCALLRQLALCCKRLYSITTSILYRKVELRTGLHLLTFTRFVLRTPHVACIVKSLVLHEVNNGRKPARHRLKLSNWKESDFSRCQDIMETITRSPDELSYWLDEILQGSWDGLASLVLLSLPNLTALTMPKNGLTTCDRRFHWVLKEAAVRQNGKNRSVLRSLNNVHLDCSKPDQMAVATRVDLFSHMPSVQKLKIDHLHSSWWAPHGQPPEFIDLAELTLNYCYLRGPALVFFIQFFKNLRKLDITDTDSSMLLDIVSTSSLTPLKAKLEELILQNYSPSSRRSSSFSPASLTSFRSLRIVSLDIPSFLGYGFDEDGVEFEDEEDIGPELKNLLPLSLESLTLKRCDWRIIEHLTTRNFLEANKLPSLRNVTVCIRFEFYRVRGGEGGKWTEIDIDKVWPSSAMNQAEKLVKEYGARGVSLVFAADHF